MTPDADVEVVVPTWNGRALLERCLETLGRQTAGSRVIVVDNGSSDGTGAMIERRFPDVQVIALPENRGFATAVNAGVESGTAPYVVLVNNDVECDPSFVEQIVAPFGARGEIGMVAGLLLRPGRRRIDSFGLELDRTLAAFPRFAGAPYPEPELHDFRMAGPSGGAAAYRRTALEQVGGFDANLFAYMEDADVALALRAAGWDAAGAAGALGVHLGSATIGRRSRFQVEVGGASRAYMLRKYGVLRAGVSTSAWALAVEAGVCLVESVMGRDLAALRGRVRGWRAARGQRAPVVEEAINPHIGIRGALARRWRAVRPPS